MKFEMQICSQKGIKITGVLWNTRLLRVTHRQLADNTGERRQEEQHTATKAKRKIRAKINLEKMYNRVSFKAHNTAVNFHLMSAANGTVFVTKKIRGKKIPVSGYG